LPLLQT